MQRNKRNGHYESAELEQKIYYQVMTLPFYFNIHPKHIPLSSHYLVLVEVNNFILGTSKCIKHSPLGSHYLPTSFFAFFEKIPILVFVFLFEAPKSHNLTHYSLLITHSFWIESMRNLSTRSHALSRHRPLPIFFKQPV